MTDPTPHGPTELLSSRRAAQSLGVLEQPEDKPGARDTPGVAQGGGEAAAGSAQSPGGAQIGGSPAGNQGTSSPADSKWQHRGLTAVPQELPGPFWALSHCTDLCR